MSICLNMIVRNESHIIISTLENLCSYINFDYWVICDTGSTDNTIELIKEFFKNNNINGELIEHKWVDFGHNRTLALECAYNNSNKTDYLLIFDADDKIVGEFKLPVLTADKYMLQFGTDYKYIRPLLISNKLKWKFIGVLHESLDNIDKINTTITIEGNYHIISGRTGNRNMNPNKYRDDAIVLKNAFDKETNIGLKCRYAFYCAQSYKDANMVNEAIIWYEKCLELPNWVQEKYYSCMMLGSLYIYHNPKDKDKALFVLLKSMEYDMERIECIVMAMNIYRDNGMHHMVNMLYHKFKNYKKPSYNKLFLDNSKYNNEIEYNNSISAYYTKDMSSGYECCKKILDNKIINDKLYKMTEQNIKFYK